MARSEAKGGARGSNPVIHSEEVPIQGGYLDLGAPVAPARSGLEVERDGRIGFEDPEAEALLDIEPHDIGVMIEIADRQVLPAIELEIPTSKTEHDATFDAGRPHQGPTEDLPKMVEEQMPPKIGALDDPRVDVRTDG